MKEIKAFIHRNRTADVVRELGRAGFRNLSIIDVKGMLRALDARERDYSLEIGEEVITEVKLELVCDDAQVTQAVDIIRANARTGRPEAGWIYVSEVQSAFPIGEA